MYSLETDSGTRKIHKKMMYRGVFPGKIIRRIRKWGREEKRTM